MSLFRWVLIVCMLLVAAVRTARAEDMIYFSDGRVLLGEVIKETDDEVEAKGTMAGVELHSTFKKSQIASIIRNVSSRSPSKVESDVKDDDSSGDFLIVPLKGTFGEDVYPLGLINAMDWAVKHKVPRIVMVIDSPGGYVWASRYMADKMKEYDDKLNFTMVIENSISASIWPTFASDDLMITPGGTFGGAVVYHMTNTGSAEVDMKMNSILAAEVAAMAEKHGHSGALARAMMLSGQQVWAVPAGPNKWTLTSEPPADKSGAKQLSVGQVFTLTGVDCVRYGIARSIPDTSVSSISHALGNLKSAGDQGEKCMKNAKTACDGLIKRVKQWRQNVADRIEKLKDAAATAKDKESFIRRIDDVASTITNSIGPLRDQAKALHMMPLFESFSSADVIEYRKRIDKIKEQIRK
ncbi:MAG: hypothetical protein KF691_03610 [Phycisphaeraceae bacterium]|nr:hypothetical protein [Phycisphaeraceae bacterium]